MKAHGTAHMKAIGQRGFETTVNRHFGGSKAEYIKFLHGRASELGVGGFVDRELQRRLDQGEQIASMEIPILSDAEDDPFF